MPRSARCSPPSAAEENPGSLASRIAPDASLPDGWTLSPPGESPHDLDERLPRMRREPAARRSPRALPEVPDGRGPLVQAAGGPLALVLGDGHVQAQSPTRRPWDAGRAAGRRGGVPPIGPGAGAGLR